MRRGGSHPSHPSHPSHASHLSYFLLFALLTIWVTWPLAAHITTGIIGGTGDNLNFVWDFWWTRTAIAGHQSVFWTPDLFAPIGTSLATHTLIPILTVPAAWMLPRTAPLTLYNAALLLSTFLNFLCAYGAAHALTRDRLASTFAAVTFGAAPFLLVRLVGHLNVLSAWGLPLVLLATLRYERKPTIARVLVLSSVLAAVAYTDYYDFIFASGILVFTLALSQWHVAVEGRAPTPRRARVLTVLAALACVAALALVWVSATGGVDTTVAGIRLRMTETFNLRVGLGFVLLAAWIAWTWPRITVSSQIDRPDLKIWTLLPIAFAGLLVLLGPLILAAVRLWQSGDYSSQAYVWRNAPPGIDLATIFLGNQLHPVTGDWTTSVYRDVGINRIEGSAWLGVAPSILLLVAIRRFRSRRDVQALLWMAGFFFIWSLGPYLRVLDYNTGLMLPQTLLRFVPIAANARIPGRAFIVVQLMVALVGAVSLAELRERSGRRGVILAALAIACVLADYCPRAQTSVPVEVPQIYNTLKALPPGVVLEIPLGLRDGFGSRGDLDHRVLLYQTIHEHPQMGGAVSRLSRRIMSTHESDPIVRPILDLSERLPSAGAMSEDRSCQASLACSVRYVIVDKAAASSDLDAFVQKSFSLRLLERDGSRTLSVVDGVPGCQCATSRTQ